VAEDHPPYRGYDAYQRRTDRQIPIVIVEPR
jgi:hypothetical protein